ncbi:hypothetical protein Q1695_002264 [Nippostrongylus brasiliensis]|nr:hypothetical protein Q1695_002264 [Nippostrongylus brasiliensis]
MSTTTPERLENVSFIENFVSPYLKGVKCSFTQRGRRRSFDLVFRHSSVATLLYHTTQKKFVFVRQFRPAVLVGHILRQPENLGKNIGEVAWSNYDASHGYTLELCAGLIDKDIPILDITREEIEEECGYKVRNEDLQFVATFSVAAHESGGTQYLFYAEIDDSMKITEGGGNVDEGEYITKVFLSESEVLEYINGDFSMGPPSVLYALLWWFVHKSSNASANSTLVDYSWKPKDVAPMTDFEFENMSSSARFVPHRMQFTLGPITRTWDLAFCDDSFSILLFNETTKELLLTQRFRPAALVGQVRHRSPPGTDLATIDWKSQPMDWAYTLEMCSGHYKRGTSVNEIERLVAQAVSEKCGYELQSMRFVTSFIVGISFAGDRQRSYYARINESMRLKDWSPPDEDITPFSIPCSVIPSFLRAERPTGPPAILYMMRWFLNSGELAS